MLFLVTRCFGSRFILGLFFILTIQFGVLPHQSTLVYAQEISSSITPTVLLPSARIVPALMPLIFKEAHGAPNMNELSRQMPLEGIPPFTDPALDALIKRVALSSKDIKRVREAIQLLPSLMAEAKRSGKLSESIDQLKKEFPQANGPEGINLDAFQQMPGDPRSSDSLARLHSLSDRELAKTLVYTTALIQYTKSHGTFRGFNFAKVNATNCRKEIQKSIQLFSSIIHQNKAPSIVKQSFSKKAEQPDISLTVSSVDPSVQTKPSRSDEVVPPSTHSTTSPTPLSESDYYKPYLNLGSGRAVAQYQSNSAFGIYDFFLPIVQSDSHSKLLFSNLRVLHQGISDFETNAHVGYRWKTSDNTVFGVYGAVDSKMVDGRNTFNRAVLGGEYWKNRWYVGGNLYTPLGRSEKEDVFARIVNDDSTMSTYSLRETCLTGMEGEVGYAFSDHLRGVVGAYYAQTPKEAANLFCPKVSVVYEHNKPVLGLFNDAQVELGSRWNESRGLEGFLQIGFRFGSPVRTASASNTAQQSTVVANSVFDSHLSVEQNTERHMTSLIRRDSPMTVKDVTVTTTPIPIVQASMMIDPGTIIIQVLTILALLLGLVGVKAFDIRDPFKDFRKAGNEAERTANCIIKGVAPIVLVCVVAAYVLLAIRLHLLGPALIPMRVVLGISTSFIIWWYFYRYRKVC